ncbi:MAG: Nif3-like dinuclear metal center hexameric protein [Acidimicrobiia bacterium]
MRVQDILSALAPLEKAATWDPVGVQLGDPVAEVSTIAVCHEVTEQVVDVVIEDPPDLLIAYHPLLFRSTNRLTKGTSPGGRALRLAQSGVNLGIVHTAFDVLPGGAADALADAIGIVGPRAFGPIEAAPVVKIVTFLPHDRVEEVHQAMMEAGAGSIGRYEGCSFRADGIGTFLPTSAAEPVAGVALQMNHEPEVRLEMIASRSRMGSALAALMASHPYEEPAFDVLESSSNSGFIGRYGQMEEPLNLGVLARLLEDRLPTDSIRFTGNPDAVVSTAAAIPGSGGDSIAAAAAMGVDVVVTGDVSHHRAVEARDRGLLVLDAGHSATERPGMRRLYSAVLEFGLETRDLIYLNTDPWGR